MARKRARGGGRRGQEAARRRLVDSLRVLVAHGAGTPVAVGEGALRGLGAELGLAPADAVALFKELVRAGEVRVVPRRGGRRYIDGVGALVADLP